MPKLNRRPPAFDPFWQTTDGETARLYLGDVLDVLRRMPSKSVHMVVTSPPYWSLRDYGTGTWQGGDEACDHLQPSGVPLAERPSGTHNVGKGGSTHVAQELKQYKGTCGKCGAERVDQQIGAEATPQGFVDKMVEVFAEVRRVLRDDGTLWLNLGDSYAGGGGYYPDAPSNLDGASMSSRQDDNSGSKPRGTPYRGLPSGNLVGIPWRVALALQADGWVLRQEVPWVKRSPMPESVKNRPAKALEHVFMFVKRMAYYYDDFAVKRRQADATGPRSQRGTNDGHKNQDGAPGQTPHILSQPRPNKKASTDGGRKYQADPGCGKQSGNEFVESGSRNFWQTDLWFDSVDKPHGLTGVGDELVGIDVTTAGYAGAHFATYPRALIEPFIAASTSEHGCCADCGAPWKRIVESKAMVRDRPNDYTKRTGEDGTGNSCANSVAGVESRTVGWRPDCECHGKLVKRKIKVVGQMPCDDDAGDDLADLRLSNNDADRRRQLSGKALAEWKTKDHDEGELTEKTTLMYESDLPLDEHPVVPCTVLDPFIGAATTAVVCLDKGRRCWGIDLSEKYLLNNAIPRVEGSLMSRPTTVRLVPARAAEAMDGGEEIEFE